MLADAATTNSVALTVPITLRGSIRPAASRVGVATGPQPPPPAASRNPAHPPNTYLIGNFAGAVHPDTATWFKEDAKAKSHHR